MPRTTCAACGHPLTSFCPRCRGRRGGQVSSPAKTKAVQRNALKPRKPRETAKRLPVPGPYYTHRNS